MGCIKSSCWGMLQDVTQYLYWRKLCCGPLHLMIIWGIAGLSSGSLKVLTVNGQYIYSSICACQEKLPGADKYGKVHQQNTRKKNFIDIPRNRLSGTLCLFPELAWKLFNHPPADLKILGKRSFVRIVAERLTILQKNYFKTSGCVSTCPPPVCLPFKC